MASRNWTVVALLIGTALVSTGAQAAGNRCPQERDLRSIEGKISTQVTFVNAYGATIRIYWLNYNGGRQFYQQLAAGRSFAVNTYVTHPWVVTDSDENCIEVYLPQPRPSTIQIRPR
ncbi:MAG: hypothetical protein ACREDY_26400 [Bradyrhizobium sp.]